MNIKLLKETIQNKIRLAKIKKQEDEKKKDLINDINRVRMEIDSCKARFDLLSDEKLIESLIYEERALYARYSFLLDLAKDRNVYSDIIFS